MNLAQVLATIDEPFDPRTVATMNGHAIMVVKIDGEFVWHQHSDTDDFFLVLSGELTIQLRDGDVTLGPGELYVVPKGVEHCPKGTAEILLIEPLGTDRRGD